jgi:CheY-like chemotaxis protein
MTLLIVDDNASVRKMLHQMMQPLFESIDECEDGSAAVSAYLRRRHDIVIMDIQMPILDGIEATEAIIARHPDARIYLITAHDDPEYRQRASYSGVQAFCRKDDIADLHALLQTIVEAGHVSEENTLQSTTSINGG